jgi:hypothetical protein
MLKLGQFYAVLVNDPLKRLSLFSCILFWCCSIFYVGNVLGLHLMLHLRNVTQIYAVAVGGKDSPKMKISGAPRCAKLRFTQSVFAVRAEKMSGM